MRDLISYSGIHNVDSHDSRGLSDVLISGGYTTASQVMALLINVQYIFFRFLIELLVWILISTFKATLTIGLEEPAIIQVYF